MGAFEESSQIEQLSFEAGGVEEAAAPYPSCRTLSVCSRCVLFGVESLDVLAKKSRIEGLQFLAIGFFAPLTRTGPFLDKYGGRKMQP